MNTTLTKSGFTAIINAKGAELFSLKKNSREYIWEGNPEFWGKHSPVLFPIVGTLKNNCYTYNGKTYHLPRHGFARDCTFEVVSQTENQVVFCLKSNAETLEKYPFRFELNIKYTLEENRLFIDYTVTNGEDFPLPFSIGAHPAFALPGTFESYALRFEADEQLTAYELEEDLLSQKTTVIPLNQKDISLSYSLFEKDALIFKEMNSNRITILENGQPLLHFNYADFPNFGIWTKPGAPFICLEPWIGYSDTLETTGNILEKEAIRLLAANTRFNCTFSIEIL